MEKIYNTVKDYITNEDRAGLVEYVISLYNDKKITVQSLYQNVLHKVLNEITCMKNNSSCIWKEHVQTSIVRTVIECSYPYIIKEVKKKSKLMNESVIVVCPPEEYHEIGAKMAHDFFLLEGYDTTFIGANTPLKDIVSAVECIKPKYIALSVTNYYNIFNAKKIIDTVKVIKKDIVVVLGGQAFKSRHALENMEYDFYLDKCSDVSKIQKGGVDIASSKNRN